MRVAKNDTLDFVSATQIDNPVEILYVPSSYSLEEALDYAFRNPGYAKKYRIILETPGPHTFVPKLYASSVLESITIEAASMTDNMGSYYGHDTGAYSLFGNKGLVDVAISGIGPFSLALSNSNTTVTVSGTALDCPIGFGLGCAKVPNWGVGAPPNVILAVPPNFKFLNTQDSILWFDASTNLVTEHTITEVSGNSLTVSPALPGPLIRGSGFSVKPRATVFVPGGLLLPAFTIEGMITFLGIHIDGANTGPFPPSVTFTGTTYVSIRQCLSHIELASSAGARMFMLTPNTNMDKGGGVPAKNIANAAGNIIAFRQSFIGPNSGLWCYGSGRSTMCFSSWINCNIGIFIRSGSAFKTDGAECVRCVIGAECRGSSTLEQSAWFDSCGTALKLRTSSTYVNSQIVEFGPLPDFPLVVDGQGSGIGVDLDFDSSLNTGLLRICDVTTEAILDGTPSVVPTVAVETLFSNSGVGSYGTRNSGIVMGQSDLTPSTCPV